MIILDDRTGSKELLYYFKPYGDVDVQVSRLEYGDACFVGKGPDGDCMIGIERKRITDLIQSMRDRRLSGHQLPGLCQTYGFVYLIVEGIYRPGDRGDVTVLRGKEWRSLNVSYREVDSYLTSLELFPPTELRTGVIVRRTNSESETVAQIVSLYKYFSKDWHKHNAHNQLYAPAPDLSHRTGRKVSFRFRVPTTLEKMAAQLPGIDTKCEVVARHFANIRDMATADESDWEQIKGIGKKLANRIVQEITK